MLILVGFTGDVGITFVLFDFGVLPYLFGDRCGIFMNEPGDCSEGVTVVQSFFDVDAV